ncbi:uncharacterized protein CBL_01294 [Carabus blaptoides fortunei]
MWAWKLFDSSSKIPTGLLAGNIADLGFFDECLSAKYERQDDVIRGKYCKAAIPLKKIIPGVADKESFTLGSWNGPQTRGAINLQSAVPRLTLALCVPDSCDVESLNSLLNGTLAQTSLDYTIINCQSSEPETLSTGDWITVAFFALVFVIMITSTAYDLFIHYKGQEPAHLILVAFSVYTNGRKLLTVSKNPGQLECINGLRFISMMWVVIGHTYFTAFFSPGINALDSVEWGEKITSILTPSLAVMVLLHVTLIRYLGSGPNWPEVTAYLEGNCQKYWWSTLLYIQNYVNPDNTCITQTWYLSVDMQLFIVSPILLIPLGKWPKITLQLSALLVVLSVVSPFLLTWYYEIDGLMSKAIFNTEFTKYYYDNTYARFGPTLIGIILGYFVYYRKENNKLNMVFKNKYLNLLGWVISVGSLLVITFGPNNMFHHEYNRLESSLFLAMHRVAWAIALTWVIYACLIGRGGLVNSFLSLSAFQVLGRLTYSMYLIHLSLQFMKIGYLRVPIYFSDFQNMYNFWGDFVFTAAIAIVWTLAFESPILIVEKIIFKDTKKKPVKNENKNRIATET